MRKTLYWAAYLAGLPLTLLGLLLHALGAARPFCVDSDGVVHWRPLPFGVHALIFKARLASAYTLGGSVVWASEELYRSRPDLVRHEQRHAWQGFMAMSLAIGLYLLSYLAMAGWSLTKTGNIWEANIYEIHAKEAEAGP